MTISHAILLVKGTLLGLFKSKLFNALININVKKPLHLNSVHHKSKVQYLIILKEKLFAIHLKPIKYFYCLGKIDELFRFNSNKLVIVLNVMIYLSIPYNHHNILLKSNNLLSSKTMFH